MVVSCKNRSEAQRGTVPEEAVEDACKSLLRIPKVDLLKSDLVLSHWHVYMCV